MTATIKTFQSGTGDCILLRLEEGEQRYAIMVDCGWYEEPIKHYIQNTLEEKIDLLIVTHIDNDHIVGVKDMLTDSVGQELPDTIYSLKRYCA